VTVAKRVIAYLAERGCEVSSAEVGAALGMRSNDVSKHVHRAVRRGDLLQRHLNANITVWRLPAVPVDDGIEDGVVQRVVPAHKAPPIRPRGPRSVFELALETA
jgi:hypothetical protein